MARSKLKLEYISNDSTRKTTFKKRKKGIMKKLKELTILCGVEGCVIVYESKNESNAEIWPSQNNEVRRVLNRFFIMSKTNQKDDKMLDQRSYLRQRIKKAKEQLMKKLRANREKEMVIRIRGLVKSRELPENLTMDELNTLAYVNDQEMKKLEAQLKERKEKDDKKMKMVVVRDSTSLSPPSSSFVSFP